jgi:hypothetical protein
MEARAVTGRCAGPRSPAPAHARFAQEEDVRSDNMTLLRNLPKVDGATQSDLAFQGSYAYAGTYSGLRVIDITDPANARQLAFEPCNGGQFDVSVWGDLLSSVGI